MSKTDLHIPTFVNYDCEICGWCCKQYDVTFSEAEHARLSKPDWGRLESAMAGREWCSPIQARRSPDSYRLRYKAEGGCVFLSAENQCLMHSHVGEFGKPLGCCVFPFTFVNTPTGVYTGVRFSCPSVAYGRGRPLIHREEQTRKKLKLVEQAGQVLQYDENVVFSGPRILSWRDYMHLEGALLRLLLRDDVSLTRRLYAVFKLVETLRQSKFEKVRGKRFKEFIGLLEGGLLHEAAEDELPRAAGGIYNVLFRQFCFMFQRREGGAYRELSFGGRLKVRLANFRRGVQFAFACGAPQLIEFPGPFRVAEVARLKPSPLEPIEELALSRYLAAKIFGKQYFGKLFFRYPLVTGLTFLLLSAGAVMWFARARALARGAETTGSEDVIEGIRYVDFCYGSSVVPGLILERVRTKILGSSDHTARVMLAQFG